MLINKRTGESSLDTSEMKLSDIVKIKEIMDNISINLIENDTYSKRVYDTLKTHVLVDYIDDETDEEITKFHPNIEALYNEEEQTLIKELIELIESFINKYEIIKNNHSTMFDPVTRLEELNDI